MLWVYRSNRTEKLVTALTEVLCAAPLSPMETEWLVVSNIGMRGWLQRELARRLGIFAGACFPFPREVLDTVCFGAEQDPAYLDETVTLAVFELLPSLLHLPRFQTLRRYLDGDESGARRMELSAKIAQAFGEYTLYRPEMVLQWESGAGEDWQAALWRDVVKQLGSDHIARGAVCYLRNDLPLLRPRPPFRRIFFFAPSGFPPLYMSVLRSLAEAIDVHLLLLSPSSEWWGDIRTKRPGTLELTDEAEMPEYENPFLSSLGRVGRDFQWILEETATYDEYPANLYVDSVLIGNQSALQMVQSDILNLRFGPRSDPRHRLDRSIRIVSCYNPEREVEVLKDHLLDLFESGGESLGPDDVLVMAPNIDVYAPFVEAVFSTGNYRIPFNLTTGMGKGQGVAQAYFAILDLYGSRLRVADLFDLLAFEPVRARFDLDEEAVLAAERWVRETEVRWGIDAAHREAHGQPGFDQNSWRFGLDRLMLGLALDEESGLFEDVAPACALSGDDARNLGRFAAFAETLFSVLASFDGASSLKGWLELLRAALSRLIHRGPTLEVEHQHIGEILDRLEAAATRAGQVEAVSFEAAIKLIRDALAEESGHKGWRPFGVTFSDFNTMRCVPFKVIALLGMNEGTFPRRRRAPKFDLIAQHPKVGDRQVTNDDRYHFLEAILSTRETLFVSYVGQGGRDNATIPPSVLVSELEENLKRCFDIEGDTVTAAHPLQPFSARYFVNHEDPHLFSYSRSDLFGAMMRQGDAAGTAPFFTAPLKPIDRAPVITLDALIRFYSQPAAALLRERLRMRFSSEAATVEPREPMRKGGPEDRRILQLLVRRGAEGADPAAVRRLVRASGLLPFGRAGEVRFARLAAEAAPIVHAVKEYCSGDPVAPTTVDLGVTTGSGPVRLVGTLDQVWRAAQIAYGFAYLTGARLIRLWIRHLALFALERDDLPDQSICIGRKRPAGVDSISLTEPPVDPLLLLGDLVDLYRIGQERPLHLIPRISYDYAAALEKNSDTARARMRARSDWMQGFESGDVAVAMAFRGGDPLGPDLLGSPLAHALGFENLAERVFFPLLDAAEEGGV